MHELTQAIDELQSAFPGLRRRLQEAPRVYDEWAKYFRPLSRALVSDGISRYVFSHNHEPTMEEFLDYLDTVADEKRREASREPVVFAQQAPRRDDLVPVDDIKALFQAVYKQFDARTLEIEAERRQQFGGQWRWGGRVEGRRVSRHGMIGPLPGWDPGAPMLSRDQVRDIYEACQPRQGPPPLPKRWEDEEVADDRPPF